VSPSAVDIQTIAVIGAGAAGRDFSCRCAAGGFRVLLEDVMPANLRLAEQDYTQLAAGGAGTLELVTSIEAAVRQADLVVDFVPDELESKLEIFCLVDRMAPPKTIVLTPSYTLSIRDLASCTYRGDRCFAVRGALVGVDTGETVKVLHPPNANHVALEAITVFLRSLGAQVELLLDTETPQLVR